MLIGLVYGTQEIHTVIVECSRLICEDNIKGNLEEVELNWNNPSEVVFSVRLL
jgi:hypothetical protein